MRASATTLPEVLLIEPTCHHDARGFFLEMWHQERYLALGLPPLTAQDNLSWSQRHVLRGLHFQYPAAQAKLVQVLVGEIFDVAVDIRHGSPQFGSWTSAQLSAENHHQLFIPEGFAHGFFVVSNGALVTYRCSAPYEPACERGIAWNDPTLAIPWPTTEPILSDKDGRLPRLHDVLSDQLPNYQPAREQAIRGATSG